MLEFEPTTISFIPILIGLFAGLLVATTGVGGAAIATPAIMLLLGVSAPVAIATDAVFCAAIKLLGIRAHRSALWDGRSVAIKSLAFSAPAAVVGALLVAHLGRSHGGDQLLERFLGVLLIVAAAVALTRTIFPIKPGSIARGLPPAVLPLGSLLLGFLVGLTSIGAGSLFLPLFLFTVPLPFRSVVAIDIAQGFVLALVIGAAHLAAGAVDPQLLALLMVGGVPGVLIGGQLHGTVNPRALVSATAGVLVLVGVGLVV